MSDTEEVNTRPAAAAAPTSDDERPAPRSTSRPTAANDDSDSDLSELSDSEDEGGDDEPAKTAEKPREQPRYRSEPPESDEDAGAKEDDRDGDYGGRAEAMFDDDEAPVAPPKRVVRQEDNDEDDDEEERVPRARVEKAVKRKKEAKARPRQREDEDVEMEEPLDDATIRRRELDARMEAIGKSVKRKRPRKAKDDADDAGIDEIVSNVCKEMKEAVEKDRNAKERGEPALSKTKILPKVQATMQNSTMQQAILDNPEFLSVVREYLEPLNDGSLPSLNVQRTIIEQLSRMDGIDTEILKESGLGKVVNFYTRYPKVEREIARKANQLIDKWSRPIINQRVAPRRNEDELDDDEIDEIEDSAAVKRSKQESLLKRKVEERHRQQEESKGSRLPSVIGHAYTMAPPPLRKTKSTEDEKAEEQRLREIEKLNRYKRKAQMAKAGR